MVRHRAIAAMWVLNQLHLTGPRPGLSADALIDALDAVLADAPHRRATIHDGPTGDAVAAQLAGRLPWSADAIVVMPLEDEPAEPPAGMVREVPEDAFAAVERAVYEDDVEEPQAPAIVAELGRGRAAIRAAAPGVRRLVACDEGVDAAHATLFCDGTIAQIENVGTLTAHRRRGLASAVVAHGARLALAEGHELVFIMAEQGSAAERIYDRLGFRTRGRLWTVTRVPA